PLNLIAFLCSLALHLLRWLSFPYTTLFRSQRRGRRPRLRCRLEVARGRRGAVAHWRADAQKRKRAWAVLALMVGTITVARALPEDRKSTSLNSSHLGSAYAGFCLKKKRRWS